jgi:hypothetical protein
MEMTKVKLDEVIDMKDEPQIQGIYVDLDGVLVDFVKLAKQWVPGWEDDNHPNRNKKLDRELWGRVGGRAKNGIAFWGQMDPIPDAHELWNYLKKYNPQILSAKGVVGNPETEKRAWVAKHLGADVTVNLVTKAAEKSQLAAPGRILIDDKRKALDPWIAAGGIGILHTSAANTIQQLKELGL